MCLIVAKPRGQPMPKNKLFKQWFKSHPDGFGLAFNDQNRIRILKGAMSVKEMLALLNTMRCHLYKISPTDVNIIFHFRQATDGDVEPKNCHPFPLTNNQAALASTDVLTDCALTHNGIIFSLSSYYAYGYEGYGRSYRKTGKTDTQEFVEKYLIGLEESLWNPSVQELIKACTESKFALLSEKGITYIGQFIEDKGYSYSNGGYKTPTPSGFDNKKWKAWSEEDRQQERWDNDGKDYLENPAKLEGGACCDYCQAHFCTVYYLPDDDASILCAECFENFVGRKPSASDRAY